MSSTFYRSANREEDNAIRYVNIVVWKSMEHFESVVNAGFGNELGENKDAYRLLGKGFPEPIKVSPGQFEIIAEPSFAPDKPVTGTLKGLAPPPTK